MLIQDDGERFMARQGGAGQGKADAALGQHFYQAFVNEGVIGHDPQAAFVGVHGAAEELDLRAVQDDALRVDVAHRAARRDGDGGCCIG